VGSEEEATGFLGEKMTQCKHHLIQSLVKEMDFKDGVGNLIGKYRCPHCGKTLFRTIRGKDE
jgi:hypothetical protein